MRLLYAILAVALLPVALIVAVALGPVTVGILCALGFAAIVAFLANLAVGLLAAGRWGVSRSGSHRSPR